MKNLSKLRTVLFSSSMLLASLSVSNAEEYKVSDFTEAEAAAVLYLSLYTVRGANWERLKTTLENRFDQQDKTGQGISKDDVDLTNMITQANARALSMQKWLRYDLDGNGSVTQDELEALSKQPLRANITNARIRNIQIKPTAEQSEMILDRIKENADFPDENNDGTITLEEMLKAAGKSSTKTNPVLARFNRTIGPKFDANKDGVVQKEEYLKIMRDTFVRFDKNKNDILERREREDLQDASAVLSD
jgi:Ca2+-binding EF-hand superfamily protein